MKKIVDLRGLTCPEPVLRTKKLIDDTSITCIEALVDNEVNVQNLSRLAGSQNLSVLKEESDDHFRVVLERQNHEQTHDHQQTKTSVKKPTNTDNSAGTIVFLSRDTFGEGDHSEKGHDFSAHLLNLFLQTICQSGHEPRAILMVNSGVKLMDPGGPYIKVLNDLRDKGIEVLACGLCLDFYGLKEKVPVEQVTNMFAICEYLFSADRIISP